VRHPSAVFQQPPSPRDAPPIRPWPKRNEYVAEGYSVVVDLDLEKFFDRVNHDNLIRRRLRSYLWRQWQNGHNRFKELCRQGVPKFPAAVAAGSPTGFWRMSGHPVVQQALRNHYFDSLGLPRLHVAAQA
jgi:hypothetical protein